MVGLGNTGSHAALTIARLGVRQLTLFDPDRVESHNLSSQAYGWEDVGEHKAIAIGRKIHEISENIVINQIPDKFTGQEYNSRESIVVIAVDTMKERKKIYEEMKVVRSYRGGPLLLIDARIGGPQLEVYSFTDLDEWAKTFSDNPSQDPCGGRYICYVSVVVGGLIANQVKKFLKGEPYDKSILVHLDSLEIIKNLEW